MKKRLLSLFLAFAMVLTMVPGELTAKAATTPYLGCNQPGNSDVWEQFDTVKYGDTDIGFFFVDSTGTAQSLALSDLSFSQNYTDIIELTPYDSNGYMRIKTKDWGTVTVSYSASDGQTYSMNIISHIHAPGYYSANSATQANWLREFTVTKTDNSEVIYFIANPNNASETLSGWTPTSDLKDIANVTLSTDNKCYTITFTGLPEDGKTYGFEVIDSSTKQSVANDYITLYDGVSGSGNTGGSTGGTVQEVNVQIETDHGRITYTNTNNNRTDTVSHWGIMVTAGSSLRQTGLTFTDPVCEAGKRTFQGWRLTAPTDEGEVVLQKNMTTQQMMDYVVTAAYTNIFFIAQWDKDKYEVGGQVELDGYGGSFVVNHNVSNTDNDNDKETTGFYSIFVWKGASIASQETNVAIASDPIMADHTFEGWLEYTEGASYTVDADGNYMVYTTAQVLAITVSTDNLRYVAKWKEISIDEYTNSGSGEPASDVYYEGLNYYNGQPYVPAGQDLEIKAISNLSTSFTGLTWRVGVGLGDNNPTLFTAGNEYTVDASDSAKITLHGAVLQKTLAALNTDAFTVEVTSAEGFTYEHTVFLKDESDLGGEEDPGEGPSVSGDDITIEANGHTHHTFNHGTTQSVIIAVTANSQSDATLTYQWYCNNQAIEGATSAEYEIVNATTGALYYCKVSNGSETIQSMDFVIVFVVNVLFNGNGGTFEFITLDGSEMVENIGTGIQIGKSFETESLSVTDPEWPDGSRNFIGWNMIGEMDSQGSNLIAEKVTTEYALEYVITDKYSTIVFEAQWDGEDPGQGGGESGIPEGHVLVVFEGNDGEITVTNGTDSESFGRTETYAEPGYCFADEGISILDPVFWNPYRAFAGWLVFVGETITDEAGNECIEWMPVNEDALLTSQQLAKYEFTDENTMFQAQWEGDDADYYTNVFLDVYGGKIKLNWGDEIDDWGIRFRKDGTAVGNTLLNQLGDYFAGNPYHEEGYTFEGWLIKDENWNLIDNDKTLYTTAQIWGKAPVGTDANGDVYLTIRDNTIIYQAKWKEIPMTAYGVQVEVEETLDVSLGGGYTAGVDTEITENVLSNTASELVNAVLQTMIDQTDDSLLEELKNVTGEEVVAAIQDALDKNADLTVNTTVGIDPIDAENPHSEVEEDVKAIQNLVKDAGAAIAQLLDLYVMIETYVSGSDAPTSTGLISELPEPIVFTIEIPETLFDVAAGYSRTFTVLYRHNGVLKEIPVEQNEEDSTITFEADRFSTYALVYKDQPNLVSSGDVWSTDVSKYEKYVDADSAESVFAALKKDYEDRPTWMQAISKEDFELAKTFGTNATFGFELITSDVSDTLDEDITFFMKENSNLKYDEVKDLCAVAWLVGNGEEEQVPIKISKMLDGTTMEITWKIPADVTAVQIYSVHVHEDGSRQLMTHDVEVVLGEDENYAVFGTNHFSTYFVVYSASASGNPTPQPTPTPQPQAPSQSAPQSTQSAPTGDSAPVMLYMGLLLIAVVLTAVAGTKRRALRR